MRTIYRILLLSGLSLLPISVSAQSLSELQAMTPEDRRSYFESMSEDERSAMRQKWHDEFESLSDDEKQAVRAQRHENRSRNREAARERWNSMSEDERAAARDKRRQRLESMSEEERAAARKGRDRRMGGGRHRDHGPRGRHGKDSGREPAPETESQE